MRSTQVFAILAMVAASVSSMSIGHVSGQVAHRQHADGVHESVIQARGARKIVPAEDSSDVVKRDNTVPRRRKRGLNRRRCAPKTSTGLLQTTSAASASPAAPTSTDAPSTTPEPKSATSKAEPTISKAEPTTSKTEPATSQAEPTTSSKAKYVKTSQAPTKTSTSAKPTATNDDDGGSSSGDTYTGEATFYGTGLGACGITSKDTDYIAAASQLLYDGFEGYTGGDPNGNPICGKKVTAHYGGKSVTITIVDRCVACAKYDLDFSPFAFNQLADQSLGRLKGMTWEFD